MNLYSQKVDGSVAPVEKETPVAKEPKRKATGKGKGKKVDPTPPAPVEEPEKVETSVEDNEPTYEEVLKELDDLSDDESQPVSESVRDETPEPVAEPVEVPTLKRKRTVSKKTPPKPPVNSPEIVDDNEPPKWFMKYVENMKSFQNDVSEKKRAKKVVKTEANDYAKEQWKKPEVRQKVTDSVDSHLTKMYRQIFSRV